MLCFAVWTLERLIRGAGALADIMTRVVPPGDAVPPFFGVAYTDVATKARVCHVIPINFFVGLAQAARTRLKEGPGVKVGGKRA
jgi:hypothetical protein